LCIFTFAMIILSYLAYRKKAPELHQQSAYKMPGGVFMAWITLAFLIFVVAILALDHDTMISLAFSPLWFIGLFIAYRYKSKKYVQRSWILTHGKRIEPDEFNETN